MSGRVTDTDHGARELLARVRSLSGGRTVRVGILADAPKREREGTSGRYSLLEVAIVHEFGAGHVPARSFIRATIDEKRAEIQTLQVALAQRVLLGELTPEQALSQLGAKIAAWMQARIVAGIAPALAPSTLRWKRGKTTPLILTGQLRSSITFAVEGA